MLAEPSRHYTMDLYFGDQSLFGLREIEVWSRVPLAQNVRVSFGVSEGFTGIRKLRVGREIAF